MKRLVVILASFILLISSSFAGAADFFDHRIFEIKLNVPANISNNTITLADILQEQVIIDLKELYNEMPKKGFDATIDILPSAAITLDFKKGLHFGVSAGVDVFANTGISKDLFRFIAKGNQLNEEFKVSVNGYADVFAFAQVDVGFNLKKFNILVQPALFSSLAHAVTTDSYVMASCGENNAYNLVMKGNMDIYSSIPINEDSFGDSNTMVNNLMNNLGRTMGFDLGGKVSYKLTDFLTLSGSVRIPMVPSHLNTKTSLNYDQQFSFSLDSLMNKKKEGSGEGDSESSEGQSEETPEETTSEPEVTETQKTSLFTDPVSVQYYINRPMKFAVSAEFRPFSWLMTYYGTLGVGIKHPFAKSREESYFYFDYLIGTKLSLINIISLYLSTERTDEIFKHKATLALNFRLVEIDAGIALESENLKTSFKGSGLGAFVTACIGF